MDAGHPFSIKNVHKTRLRQEVRRAAALERQRAHRQISIDHARRLGDAKATVEVNMSEVKDVMECFCGACKLLSWPR
jgi:hypothetical protein